MARLIRELDWGSTPLGPIGQWPQSLKTVVDIMLASTSMMSLVWGAEAIHLYNDSFTCLLREHRVLALGKSALETFERSRHVFEANIAAGMAGKAVRLLAQRYPVLRGGSLYDAWFDVEYAPVRDETANVTGVLWTLKETTAQVLAEHALSESETRHRLLIESWAQALWEVDGEGVVVTDSPSWRAYTGQTLEEWLGYGWLNAIHPDDRAYAEQRWREAIAASRPIDAEFRLRAPDGSWRWTNVRAAPVVDRAGQIIKWAGMNIDVDARKRAEEAADQSKQRQTFLLALNDALRPLADPKDIQRTATQVLGRHLKASRIVYTQITDSEYVIEADYVDGVASMAGRYRIDSFGPNKIAAYEEGVTRVVPDSALDVFNDPDALKNFAALGVQAGIGVPLFKAGRMVATLVVHQREPRNWTKQDVTLAEETAERTWAALERAYAEAALCESEEKYRTLFQNLGQGYAECELIRNAEGRVTNFRYIMLNPAFERIIGLKVADMLGRTAREAVPDIADSHFEMYERIVEAGVPSRQEYRIDALNRWYENHIYPGKNDRFFALYEDITERKRAEVALRDSEAILAAAFESVPVGAAVIDQSGKAVLANAQYRHFLPTGVIPSRDPEPAHRWRAWDGDGTPLNPTDYPGARALRGERVVPGQEMLYTDDDGREIWTSVATVPILTDEQITGQVSIISDIDDLKRSTQALHDSEARFRQFSDASTNVLWIRDAVTLRIMFASPAYDAIYGIPGPDRGGSSSIRSWARLIVPEDRKRVLANVRRIQAGERVSTEFQFRRSSDGALRWVHNTEFPLRDAAGKVRWLAGLGADITDAKEATDRQGVLVAELQHRTRNLIGVVRALSDRTLADASSLEDFGKRFRPRLSALSRVQGLLSHLAAGEKVTFDELLRSELAAHGATDSLTGKVTLTGPEGVSLRSSTVQTFALALHELATNAVKYGALAVSSGHLSVRWYVDAPPDGVQTYLRVEWRENGVAMPAPGQAPRGGGYGRELIERALPYQLKARTSYEMGPDGVRCTIEVPIAPKALEGVSNCERNTSA
jgi:PAS domain S-box-containing protein